MENANNVKVRRRPPISMGEIYTGKKLGLEELSERSAAEIKERHAAEARKLEKHITLCALAFSCALWFGVFGWLSCWF